MYNSPENFAAAARSAQKELGSCPEKRIPLLKKAAGFLISDSENILKRNAEDVKNAESAGMSRAMLDRLTLTEARINGMRDGILSIALQPDPLGKGEVKTLSNGLRIEHITVPIGVVCMIYEARPNVTSDAAALCVMSGNAVILRGGKEALSSNTAIAECFRKAALELGINPDIVQVITDTSHETVDKLIRMNGFIDLLIPRGGAGLINKITQNATVPTIKTGAGNCHVYVEKSADLNKALDIIDNAKCSRPSVCNAAETLLVDEAVAGEFLPMMKKRLEDGGVELRLCEKCRGYIDGKAATDEDYATEFNDYILAVKVVPGTEQAVEHINRYSTGHSEAIVTRSMEKAEYFKAFVDAAVVYVNASTRFTDGGVFGLGAEIGISTQKLHVRGPFGLDALVTGKYLVTGNGQIR